MPRLLLLLCCLFPLWSVAQQPPAFPQSDSLTQATYRYVNATSLTLRAQPDAAAPARALIAGASRVQLLAASPEGWSQIQVAGKAGFVRSDYLVEEQDLVTAELNWSNVEAGGGTSYSSLLSPTKNQSPPSSSPKVYVCGNGRTEVYHRSAECTAMRRCSYQTLVMSQPQARAAGLRGCLKCY